MQGRQDFGLTDLGKEQAHCLASWLLARGISWEAAYVSPLSRARQTQEIIRAVCGGPVAAVCDDLAELSAGALEGLDVDQITAAYPDFLDRDITQLGDFADFGGESYDQVQARVSRLLDGFTEAHRNSTAPILVVSHGGLLFQLVKAAVCTPVPRVAILRFSNCTLTKLIFRERRKRYLAEVSWHVPLELMGRRATEGLSQLY
jgi:broad specificity phosphatase PhoE